MLTMLRRYGYCPLAFVLLLLASCAARPVFHEFPPGLALPARAPAAVNYTLQMDDDTPGRWELLGGQGALVGTFQWQLEPGADDAADEKVFDFRHDARVTDGINGNVYEISVGVVNSKLRDSAVRGMAPPRATVVDAMTGRRIGVLEFRDGFEQRIEGTWREQAVLWQVELMPETRTRRETEDGSVEDVFPASQLLSWVGGSDAGARIYAGRRVDETAGAFGAPFFDIVADRPLTRRELGDVVMLLFAIRGVQQAVVQK